MDAKPNLVHAPWTDEQVENLNRFQVAGYFHEFTCGADHKDVPYSPSLVATKDGWVCSHSNCTYTQTWAHDFMSAFSVEKEQEMKDYFKKVFNKDV